MPCSPRNLCHEERLGKACEPQIQFMLTEKPISRNLELRSNPQPCTLTLGLDDGLEDAIAIAVKVEGPLIQRTRRNGAEKCRER